MKGTSWHFRGFQRAGLKSCSAASVKTAFYCAPASLSPKRWVWLKDPGDLLSSSCLLTAVSVNSRVFMLPIHISVLGPTECFKCPCKCSSSIFKCFHSEIMVVNQNTALIKTQDEQKNCSLQTTTGCFTTVDISLKYIVTDVMFYTAHCSFVMARLQGNVKTTRFCQRDGVMKLSRCV